MADLPSGTVTFLFTDIEGSTRLWDRGRMVMARAVDRAVSILREMAGAQGGVLYKRVELFPLR
jgi:class 3 adenylate cyclase